MGARRSPANGGKRSLRTMLSLSVSPSTRRRVVSRGTAMEGGTPSGSGEMESQTAASAATGGKWPSQSELSLSASPSKRRKVDSGTATEGGTPSGSPEMESKTGTILARPQPPPPLGIRFKKSLDEWLDNLDWLEVADDELKGKAPCGESDAIESTEWMITSPRFTEGVSSPHIIPVSRKAARTYKSKARGSPGTPLTPGSSRTEHSLGRLSAPGEMSVGIPPLQALNDVQLQSGPPPWSHPPIFPPSSPVYGGNPQFMLPRPQDNYYPPPDVHHVEKQLHYGISSYGCDANPTAAPTSENQDLSYGSSQLSHEVQVPFHHGDAVVGSAGANISYIRKHSGARISIQEGFPVEMNVGITGSASQVQTAQHLLKNSYLQITASPMLINETEYSNISSLEAEDTMKEEATGPEDSFSKNVNWLNLPPLVLWQVWKSLCHDADRIRMQLVCQYWYKEFAKLLAPRPWVMATQTEDAIYHCINKQHLQELKFRCKVPAGCFSGSCNDFLIVETHKGCSLWNPTDGMILPLPLKSYVKIVMPKASDQSAFSHSPGKIRFCYGRPTDPGSWNQVICFDRSICDICPRGTEFYALNSSFKLYKLDQERSKLVAVGPEQRTDEIRKMLVNERYPDHFFLAELNEQLLVICLGRNLQSANLFKVQWKDAQTSSLVAVDDLDGWSLFLGKNQSIALNAMDFPGIYPNCLYIALEAPQLDASPTVQIYNVQSRTLIDVDYSRKLGTPFFYHLGTGDVL
ncbi:hypothetical protein ACQJBY_001945 [Aegilops geniculata]